MPQDRRRKTTEPTVSTTVRVPIRALERLQAAALADRRSLSNFLIVSALERADRLLGPETRD